jgi:hypothetical protein
VKDTDFNSRRKRRDVGAVDMSKQLHRATESEVTQSMSELEIDVGRLSNYNSLFRKRIDPVDMGKQQGRLDNPRSSFMAAALEREAAIELGQEELLLDPHKSFGAQSHEARHDVGHISMKKGLGRPKLSKRKEEEIQQQAKAASKYDVTKAEQMVRPRLKMFSNFDLQPERGLKLEVIDEKDEFGEAPEGDVLRLSPKRDVLRPDKIGGKWPDPPPPKTRGESKNSNRGEHKRSESKVPQSSENKKVVAGHKTKAGAESKERKSNGISPEDKE